MRYRRVSRPLERFGRTLGLGKSFPDCHLVAHLILIPGYLQSGGGYLGDGVCFL